MPAGSESITWRQLKRSPMFWLLAGGMSLYCLATALSFMSADLYAIGRGAATLCFLAAGVWALYRLGRRLKDRLFYRVRNRVIFFYLFTGFLPLALVLLLAFLIVLIFASNLSLFVFQSELRNISFRLQTVNAAMAEILYNHPDKADDPEFLLENFRTVIVTRAPDLPDISTMLYRVDERGTMRHILLDSPLDYRSFQDEFLPDWLQELPYSGTLIKNFSLFIYSHNLVRIEDQQYYLDLFIPFREPLFNHLLANSNLSAFVSISETVQMSGTRAQMISYQAFNGFRGQKPAIVTPEELKDHQRARSKSHDWWDYPINSANTFDVTDWFTFDTTSSTQRRIWTNLQIPLTTIVRNLATRTAVSEEVVQLLLFLIYLFVVLQVASVVVGMFIIRSVTISVRQLSLGTEEIKKGNLNYRIPVKRSDELGELSSSFNTMSAGIVALLHEVADKQRIKRELEIAREVQQKFFPKFTPSVCGIQLHGRCLPAREVSGDFFDYLPLSDRLLDVVVGDISGKGISAALLMASLQSAIRAQPPLEHAADGENVRRLTTLMQVLNRHLYRLTTPEKFATMCYLSFLGDQARVQYCNAGHESPLLVRADGSVTPLTEGGTVLGAFPETPFEVGDVRLNPGDLVITYTDGVVDSVNRQGEDFGEERLVDLILAERRRTPEQIVDRLFETIRAWSEGSPQHDDITVVIARQQE